MSDHIPSSEGTDILISTGYDSASWASSTIDMASMTSSITSPYYTTIASGTATTGSSYTISNGTWGAMGTVATSPIITTNTTQSAISVEGDADFKGDITVKGKSLNEWMETMEKRLAILVPDPKKLEQYEALQKAYKHYKMLEALCEAKDDEAK